LLAKELSLNIRFDGLYARTVTLKVKYSNMKLITRSKSGEIVNQSKDIYDIAESLLDTVDKRPIRLVGIGLSGFEESEYRQITLDDIGTNRDIMKDEALDKTLLELQRRYGGDIIKSGSEIIAERRFKESDDEGQGAMDKEK
jgi:DNA polymerase-4